MNEPLLETLVQDNTTRIVLLVLDGLGDLPDASHGWKTPLEAARTPNLDRLTPASALGRLLPVGPGITPGSGPGHLALFGYDPIAHLVGRGVLEALGAGMKLEKGDLAARANFCSVDDRGIVSDRRAGRIPTETCVRLVAMLARGVPRIEDVEIRLEPGKGHRFVAVLHGPGLGEGVGDADPHHEGAPVPAAVAHAPGAEKSARVVNAFLEKSRAILKDEHPANAVLMRGISARPSLRGYHDRFRLKAAAIAAYPMYRGVAELAGMSVLPTGEKPGDAFRTARERWNDFDFFFIHVKATDMAGEDGSFEGKVAAIESVDQALPELLDAKPDVLCVTGDHSTPVPARGHSWHPVPVLIHAPLAGADRAPRFHETAARAGSLGTLASRDLMAVLLANAGRLDKYGA
ncbi:MAG TPA: 2,3-bisphosphoglycerate-independent phosphoglycerate mutase [Candidatus Udaeobacter sp.]|jgi:2,3-bisphosphoglycerate-independent phosphoglycerate mutase|nr:2,3-bisphosphoglycerate-independent phosphoglycerate mutase [Candidatus Udaeobacter sp.]